MLNRPFSSANINIVDEKTQNTSPATICGQNVLVAQEQHQKILNTLTTSISGMQGNYPSMCQNSQYYPLTQQNCPNTVTFTFNGNQYQPFYPQVQPNYYQCQSPAIQSLNQLQQTNAIDLMRLQNQLNQPYQWKFHLDSQTSTTDLTTKGFTRPDLSNLSGILKSCWPYWLETPLRKNHKKLTLKHVTAKSDTSICNVLDQNEKSVSFNLAQRKNAETQAHLCCNTCCMSNDNKNGEIPKPPRRYKKKGKKKTSSVSDWSTAEEDYDHYDDVR